MLTEATLQNQVISTDVKMKAITQNPYRVLGMYANDSLRVMTANIARIRAYSKVGKVCEFESDYSEIFGKVNRSEETIEEAIKILANDKDKRYYSYLWLHRTETLSLNVNDIDEIIQSATNNDLDNIVNRLVCAIHRGFYGLIAINYTDLLNTAENLTESCRRKLLHTLIWHTSTKIQLEFWGYCNHACNKIGDLQRDRAKSLISKDFNHLAIERLRSEISLSTLHKDFPKWKNLDNLHEWAKFTIDLLKQTSNSVTLIPNAESQLVLSDYANVMLKACERFYADARFKNARDAEELLSVLRDLYRISYKSDVKEKCADFGKKVKEQIKYLAPDFLRSQSDTIQGKIDAFCEKPNEVRWSLMLLRDCVTSLKEIKEALGVDNTYYQRISTQIAENALYSADIELSTALRKHNNPANDKEQARKYLSIVIANCGKLISDIYQLDIEKSFEEGKAEPFLNRIVKLIEEFEIDDNDTKADISLTSDNDKLLECGSDYQKLREFVLVNPESPLLQEAMKRIWEIEDNEFPSSPCAKTLLEYKQKFPNSHNDQRILNLLNAILLGTKNGSLMEYKRMLRLWPDHPKKAVIEGRIDLINFKNCVCVGDWEDYLKSFPNGQHRGEAQRKIEEEKFKNCTTIDDYNRFILNYPASAYFDAACQKIEEIIYAAAVKSGDYSTYIKQYPYGKYAKEAYAQIEYALYQKVLANNRFSEYYKAYPNGIYTNKVKDVEETFIFRACKTSAQFKAYLATYPKGKFSDIAQMVLKRRLLKALGIGMAIFGLIGIIIFAISFSTSKSSDSTELKEIPSASFVQTENSTQAPYEDIASSDVYSSQEETEEPNAYQEPEIDYSTNRLSTGARPYRSYYGGSKTGGNEFSFKTASGSDYIVMIKKHANSSYIDHKYIRGGETATIKVPDGTYDVYFYSGNGWDPNKSVGKCIGGFVSDESVQKDGPISMSTTYEGDYYYNQTCSYTLYPVYNGNLSLQRASKEEAF